VYNADRSQGATRLLFAVNPTFNDEVVSLAELGAMDEGWIQLADQDRFYDRSGPSVPVTADLLVPALSCALWKSSG